MAWLLVTGLSGLGHGLEGPATPAGEARPAPRLHITVCQGRLSVDLWEAEAGEVLARLAREAGLAILGGPRGGTRVSAQFTDAELEVGLRRLLRLASLSYALRYAQGPAGAVVLQEVQVFRAAPEEARPPLNITEHSAEERAALPASRPRPHRAQPGDTPSRR